MTLYILWGFLLTALGLAAMWLVPKHPKLGWSVGLFSEAVWMAYAIVTHQTGFIIGAVAYGVVYGRNLWRCCAKKKSPYSELKIPLKYNYGRAKLSGQSDHDTHTKAHLRFLRYGKKAQGATKAVMTCPPKSEGLTLSAVDRVFQQEYKSVMQDILNDTNRVLWGSKEEPLTERELRNVRRLLAVQAEQDAAKRAEEAAVRKKAYNSTKPKKESKKNG